MTRKIWILIFAAFTLLALSACGGDSEPSTQVEADTQPFNEVVEKNEPSISKEATLSVDYADALSIEGQLALGTIELEDTDWEVSAVQADELLTLWRAHQSLSNSDIAAAAEVEAVLKQIQGTMTAVQIAAIAEMELTSDSMTALIEEGGLAFGRGGFRNFGGAGGEDGPGGGFPGGAFPGGIPGQGPGGGPGGGIPGGFPGGGAFGNLNEDDIATRQAQFAEGDFGGFQERILTGAVIRLLQNKTGETPAPQGIFATVFDIIAEETGLTVEEIQSRTADGLTLAEIIEAGGADKETILAKLMDALSESDQFRGQDMEEFLSNLLG